MTKLNETRILAIVLAIMSIVTILCFVVACGNSEVPQPIGYRKYVVKEGDNLWKIAMKSNGYNQMDTHYIIDDIEEESNATSLIYPGQIVYIPVYDVED